MSIHNSDSIEFLDLLYEIVTAVLCIIKNRVRLEMEHFGQTNWVEEEQDCMRGRIVPQS